MSLNDTVWVKVGVSSISGVGVIAIRDIPKGQKLYCYWQNWRSGHNIEFYDSLDNLLPEIKELIIQRHPHAVNGDIFPSPNDDAFLICFMNHFDTPNYDVTTDTAIRDIKKGEEITEDYGVLKSILLDIKYML